MHKFSAVLSLLLLVLKTGECVFSEPEKQQILNHHNEKRKECVDNVGLVSGFAGKKASDMNQLVWSAAAEAYAQTHANKCVWGHSTDPPYGENIAARTNRDFTTMTNSWYNEYDIIVQNGVWWEKGVWYPNWNVWGHFTAMCWAKTEKLGCALANCTDGLTGVSWNGYFLVCSYDPPGNNGNQDLFEVNNNACDDCGATDTCVDNNKLCDDPNTVDELGPCADVVCTPPNDCTTSTCNDNDGNCEETIKPENSNCNDAPGFGTCDDVGTCVASETCTNVQISGNDYFANEVFELLEGVVTLDDNNNNKPVYHTAAWGGLDLYWNRLPWNRWVVGDKDQAGAYSITLYGSSTDAVQQPHEITTFTWWDGSAGPASCSGGGLQADAPDGNVEIPDPSQEDYPVEEAVGDPMVEDPDPAGDDGDDGDDGGDETEGGAGMISSYGVVFILFLGVFAMV